MAFSIVTIAFIHSNIKPLFQSTQFIYDASMTPSDYATQSFDRLGLEAQIQDGEFDAVYFWSCRSPCFRAISEEEFEASLSSFQHQDALDQTDKFYFFMMSSQEKDLMPFNFFINIDNQESIEWSVLSLSQTVKEFETSTFQELTNLEKPYQGYLVRLGRYGRPEEPEVSLSSFGDDVPLSACSLEKGDTFYWFVPPESFNCISDLDFEDIGQLLDNGKQQFDSYYQMLLTDSQQVNPDDSYVADISDIQLPFLSAPEYPPTETQEPSSEPTPETKPEPKVSTIKQQRAKTSVTRRTPQKQTLSYLSGSRNNKRTHQTLASTAHPPSFPTTTENEDFEDEEYFQHTDKRQKKTEGPNTKITEFFFLPHFENKLSSDHKINLAFKSGVSSVENVCQLLQSSQEKQFPDKTSLNSSHIKLTSKGFSAYRKPHFWEQPLVDKNTLEYLQKHKTNLTFSYQFTETSKPLNYDQKKDEHNETTRIEAISRAFVYEFKILGSVSSQINRYLDRAEILEVFVKELLNDCSHFRQFLKQLKFDDLPKIDKAFFDRFISKDSSIRGAMINLFIIYFEYMLHQDGLVHMLDDISKDIPTIEHIYKTKFKPHQYSKLDFYVHFYQLNKTHFEPLFFTTTFGDNNNDLLKATSEKIDAKYFMPMHSFHTFLLWFYEGAKSFNSWSFHATQQHFSTKTQKPQSSEDSQFRWVQLLYKQVFMNASRKFLRLQTARLFNGKQSFISLKKRFQKVFFDFKKHNNKFA